MVAVGIVLLCVLGIFHANAQQTCSCGELSQCMERKHDARRQLKDECRTNCASRLGQYQAAVKACENQGIAQKNLQKEKRLEMHMCMMREASMCTDDGASRRTRRHNLSGRQRGQFDRRGRGDKGGMRGLMRQLGEQAPEEYREYISCVRECVNPGAAEGRPREDGKSGGSIRRRGRGGRRHRRGRRTMGECTEELGCTINNDRGARRDAFATCAEQSGITREDRGRHFQEMCKCMTKAFGDEQECQLPQRGLGRRRTPRSLLNSFAETDDSDDADDSESSSFESDVDLFY